MKQFDEATAPLDEAPQHPPQNAPGVLAPEAWDRRAHDTRSTAALASLEHAARYLISDQMAHDRVFLAGAQEAVEILWEAMLAVDNARVTRERVERLSSIWLPQQVLSRVRGSGPPAH